MLKILIQFIIYSTLVSASESSELEKHLEKLRAAYVLPGMAAAIYIDGNLIEHAVSGIRKVGSDEKMSKADKFHLGSCTKAMTATVAATFVEEGKLNWSDKLSDLLPNIKIHPGLENVTYEMLLAHRSGLVKDPDDETYLELSKLETSLGRQESAKLFLEKSPSMELGKFNYSNIGYIIAGYVLEQLSGKTWEMLVQERLFIPLAMKSCGFGPTSILDEKNPTQPWGHIVDQYIVKAIHNDNAPFYGPAANIHCSIPDWTKFLTMHMQGFNHESNFLNQESFDQLHKHYPTDNPDEYTYGGWYKSHRAWAQGDALTHSGTNTYNYASVWVAPKTKTILISTANRSNFSGSWATSDAISAMIRLFIKANP